MEWFRNNSLSLALFGLFLVFQIGLSVVGHRAFNQEQAEHGGSPVGYGEYLGGAHFLEATMENWESEFLQMFAYVLLTAFLIQKGSAESKKPDGGEEVDRDPRRVRNKRGAPWPVHRGVLIVLTIFLRQRWSPESKPVDSPHMQTGEA
jgi:hypothetical protein